MYSDLHLNIILQNSRNVHSTAPYMADSASVEGKNKTKSAHLKMRKVGNGTFNSVLKINW